jgi:hypothetical protein
LRIRRICALPLLRAAGFPALIEDPGLLENLETQASGKARK